MNFNEELENILKNDPLELLILKPATSPITSDQRLISSFAEINDFIKLNGQEPAESSDVNERRLFSRLKEIRKDPTKVKVLKEHDQNNLLGNPKEIETVDDILENDYLGILDSDAENIFELKNVKIQKNKADFVARRKPCKDFHKYEGKFKNIQRELSEGKRKLILFKDKHFREDSYYVLDGILLYLEKMDLKKRIFKDSAQGTRARDDARIRCIFENGLESNMYLRSLQKELYNNGSSVTETNKDILDDFKENLGGLSKEDKKTGHIYILSSLSKKPEIQSIKNLYKIGYCTTSIEERIKGVENDPTFLMAQVKIVSSYDLYNDFNPQKFENLVHTFFRERCLNVEIADKNGQLKKPKEWYVAPIRAIERVIELIASGEIVKYKYDIKTESVVEKISPN